ncbi:precorrin-6Y C5,15-methyltransferase (decarboxylating) subunit CbiT [Calorimonas adulescens]|uniref:Precorrin-6Y C5,15-methyltransferase (Decarboxylating) subunit CbiT n=1 Tax=Calorimonas adulescens TaxID=2606906 RepID=A0A5D8QEF2_9THEO|nr:precorrin-6Y C5,15-methyltransferase (decarboxylating) subunit CbiT [Calorimonas adulescens]
MTPGIPDEYFVRGNVPMTKEEIRILSISKLRLKEDSVIWDIGAGTGSVSVEAALISKRGVVYSIEKEEEGIKLINENIKKFNVENIVVVAGLAPDVLLDLPSPDRIFIGGAGDKMYQTFKTALTKLKRDGIIVVNGITLDTAYSAHRYFKQNKYKVETICVNISVSKEAGNKTMMIARNPVYIITAEKEG